MLRAFVVDSSAALEDLYRLRYEVFTQEQSKYRGIADHSGRRLKDSLDDVAIHIAVADGERIVGSVRQVRGRALATSGMFEQLGLARLAELPDIAFGFSGRLCIDPAYRGSRALLKLLELNYRSAREQGTYLDFIYCNPHIVFQYEQLGYRRYYKSCEDPQLGLQAPMVLIGDDLSHLRAVGSPFLPFALEYGSSGRDLGLASRYSETPSPISVALQGREAYLHHVETALALCGAAGVLACLPATARQFLLNTSSVVHLEPGQSPTMQGTPAKELFVVFAGTLEAADESGRSLQAAAGSPIGHEDLFERTHHRIEFRAAEACDVLVIDDGTLARFQRRFPAEFARLRERLASRFSSKWRNGSSVRPTLEAT